MTALEDNFSPNKTKMSKPKRKTRLYSPKQVPHFNAIMQ